MFTSAMDERANLIRLNADVMARLKSAKKANAGIAARLAESESTTRRSEPEQQVRQGAEEHQARV